MTTTPAGGGTPTAGAEPAAKSAVATLVATHGSSPRQPGARMWVSEGGEVVGAVTIGGCVDARVIEVAGQVLRDGKSTLLEMALGEEDAAALGMTCAGTVEVLVEPSNPSDPQDPVTRALSVAGREVAAGRRVAIVVPLTGGRGGRLLVRETGQRSGTLGSPDVDLAAATLAIDRLERGESGAALVTTPDGDLRVFVELHAPPPTLVVFGATHVAMPLVELARTVGLRTVVVDGRDQFATPERFPQADELIVGMPSDIAGTLPLGASSLVVLLSHDYKYDLPVLRAVLESRAAYVGCLGSARRGKAMLEFLAEQGVPAESLARVRMPIGLDIGAKSAPEIALSVLAEALAVLRGRPGGAMRDRRTTVSASS